MPQIAHYAQGGALVLLTPVGTVTCATRGSPATDSLPARLALVRHRMGWNLKQAAIECGLAMNAWARYEEGMAPRNLIDVVEKISARTGVDRYWLTFGDEKDPRRPKPNEGHKLPDLDSNQEPAGYGIPFGAGRRICGTAAA